MRLGRDLRPECRLVGRELLVRGLLQGELVSRLGLELPQPGLGLAQIHHPGVELLLLLRGLDPQDLGLGAGGEDVLVDRAQRFLVGLDLLRERLVLVADVEEVADVRNRVGEGVRRQDGLNQ